MGGAEVTDKEFLEDYLQFGLWQPAYFSVWLLNQIGSGEGASKSLAIQIYLNFQMALEALSMWYFALVEWKPGVDSLVKRFDGINISESPGARHSTEKALQELSAMDLPCLLGTLKQPTEQQLRGRGWGEGEVQRREEGVSEIPGLLRRAMQNRLADSGDLVRAFNKFKHGLIVLQALKPPETQTDAVALVTDVEMTDPGKARVEAIWLGCSPERLKPLVDTTVSVCHITAMLLVLVPWYHMSNLGWAEYRCQSNAVDGVARVYERLEQLRA